MRYIKPYFEAVAFSATFILFNVIVNYFVVRYGILDINKLSGIYILINSLPSIIASTIYLYTASFLFNGPIHYKVKISYKIFIYSVLLPVVTLLLAEGVNIYHNPRIDYKDLIYNSITIILFAFFEELVFRKGISKIFNRRRLEFLMFSSLLFAISHLFNPNVSILALINLFLAGVLFCLIYMRFGLLNSWIAHLSWNLITGCLFGSPVSGVPANSVFIYKSFSEYALISGGGFGIEGSIFCSATLVVSILFFYFTYRLPGHLDEIGVASKVFFN